MSCLCQSTVRYSHILFKDLYGKDNGDKITILNQPIII